MNRRRYPVAVHRSAEGDYRASPTPTITGEDIYEIADFEKLCSVHAVDKIHPDLATSGGILRTHKATWLLAMVCRWRCTLPGPR
ncbi:MAG: hypothetical protein QOI94_2274 [Acidobacteriaceae bacterium]|jgi:L-alanine-DL-glutamate epimerase-like enolase superfamily enzyme|nr:hypothetical protein [Acidobacteriaceae bacterium]